MYKVLPTVLTFFKKFIYLFWEKERESRGREREREREGERIPTRLCIVSSEPHVGLKPMNHEIMSWGETESWMLKQLSHPDTPLLTFLNITTILQILGDAVSILKKWFRKLPNLLSGNPSLSNWKPSAWRAFKNVRSGVPEVSTQDWEPDFYVIGSFHEFSVEVGCSSQRLAAMPVNVPGLTTLTALAIWVAAKCPGRQSLTYSCQ